MRFEYHADVDALYIHLSPESPNSRSKDGSQIAIGNHMVVDMDKNGVPVGIDVYQSASKLVDLSKLEAEGPIFGLVPSSDSERRVS